MSHRVVALAYDQLCTFEFGCTVELFALPRPELPVPWYEFAVCAAERGPLRAAGGLEVRVSHGLKLLEHADTIVIPGWRAVDEPPPAALIAKLRTAFARGARLCSICSGAFVLAAAGLLDGRRATTHWTECSDLARRYPLVTVDPGVLFVDDGDILTSAGSAAGIDLCLHVVRRDYGTEIATQLARQLVVPPQRDGGQAQYIDAPMPELDSSSLFADAVSWLQEHLNEPVTVEDLAARSAMSPRTFARRFLASTGSTPYQWLLRQRVQLAQRLLEMSDLPIDAVAEQSGFSTAANLRKHFSRAVHTSPQAYRRTFQHRAAG
jgi:AraC family transcriptional activator FtrA